MANPILQQLGRLPAVPQAASNPMQLLQQFQQFRQQMAGKNPQQMVQQLVQSGQMSQEQLQTLEQQAQGLLSMIRR